MPDIFKSLGYPISTPNITETIGQGVQEPTGDLIDPEKDANYLEYTVAPTRERAEGFLVLPIAGEGDSSGRTVRVVGVQAPSERLVVLWSAKRRGQFPVLPSPETDNENLVLLKSEIIAQTPQLHPPFQHFLYQVVGRYEYQLLVPDGATGGIRIPTIPGYTVSVREVTPESFVKNLF
jgi:hypothetical protein